MQEAGGRLVAEASKRIKSFYAVLVSRQSRTVDDTLLAIILVSFAFLRRPVRTVRNRVARNAKRGSYPVRTDREWSKSRFH